VDDFSESPVFIDSNDGKKQGENSLNLSLVFWTLSTMLLLLSKGVRIESEVDAHKTAVMTSLLVIAEFINEACKKGR